jgi:hypothetical protein
VKAGALVVVILLVVAALVYIGWPRGDGRDDAAVYQHYFAIGKHACQPLDTPPTDGIAVWSGYTTTVIQFSRRDSPIQRRALIAGCNAAAG